MPDPRAGHSLLARASAAVMAGLMLLIGLTGAFWCWCWVQMAWHLIAGH